MAIFNSYVSSPEGMPKNDPISNSCHVFRLLSSTDAGNSHEIDVDEHVPTGMSCVKFSETSRFSCLPRQTLATLNGKLMV